jgi:hypothetical protein
LKVAATDAPSVTNPEYTHGNAGNVKNALNWSVNSETLAQLGCDVQRLATHALRGRNASREAPDNAVIAKRVVW